MATTLTWPRRGTFVDRQRTNDQGRSPKFTSEPGNDDYATVKVEDPDRKEQYLDRGWIEGTPEENDLVGGDEADATDAAEQIDPKVFVQAFIAQDATDQVAAIEAGEVDAYLDAIADANANGEDYATVEDAIEMRRAELEE